MFKKVFFNTGAQVFGKAITASITLVVTLLIGRALGPAGYGEFTKIFVFVGYFYTLADFGLNTIFIKLAKDDHLSLLRILIGLRIVLGLVLATTAIIISFLLPYDQIQNTGFSPLVKIGIIIASATIITQSLFITANAHFQKILRYDLSTVAAVIGYLVILAITLVVNAAGGQLLGYVAAYALGGLTLVLVAFWLITKRANRLILPKFSPLQSFNLVKRSLPVGAALIFNLIYFRIDVFILASYRPSEEVGLYGLSYQFFEAALAIPIFFANSIYPLLTKLYSSSRLEFKKQVGSWLKILIGISFLLAIVLILIAYLIPALYDQRFAGSVRALQILAVGLPFFFISALLWHILIIYNKQKYLTVIYAVGAIFNITANLIFIPQYGYLAAATITVISEGLIMLLLAASLYIVQKEKRNS